MAVAEELLKVAEIPMYVCTRVNILYVNLDAWSPDGSFMVLKMSINFPYSRL